MSDQLTDPTPSEIAAKKTVEEALLSLSKRERMFFSEYMKNSNLTDAYKVISPKDENGVRKNSDDTCQRNGWKMWKKIKEKIGSNEILLEAQGLGVNRLFSEINKRLNSFEQVTFEGRIVGSVEDNKTRMAATTLLSKIHNFDSLNNQPAVQVVIQRAPTNEIQVVNEVEDITGDIEVIDE